VNFSRLDENQKPIDVRVDDERIRVAFEGGLELSVPTIHYPRLHQASSEQRKSWRLIGLGAGIHWPDVDEDLSIRGLFQTYRELPKSPVEQIPALVSDLMKTTGRLNKLFPGKSFTPDGHLVGSIGEVVAEYIYDLTLEPCSTPQIDAKTKDKRTVQVKLTGHNGARYGFRWPLQSGEERPDVLVALKLTSDGFEEVYNGHFPVELLESKGAQRNGQIALSVTALKSHRATDALPRAKTFEDINRWFTPELAEVA
jgi:hypothetical protein